MATPGHQKDLFDTILGWVLLGGLILVSTTVTLSGRDVFRLGKELSFLATGIIATMVLTVGALTNRPFYSRDSLLRAEWSLPLSVLGWSLVCSFFSIRPSTSLESMKVVFSGAIIFYSFCLLASREPRSRPFLATERGLWTVFSLAAINGAVGLAQSYGMRPLVLDRRYADRFISQTALIGNPNDVGSYLLAPALAAVTLTVFASGRRRIVFSVMAFALTYSLWIAQTRTALIAFLAGLVTLALVVLHRYFGRRAFIVVTVATLIVVATTVAGYSARVLSRGIDTKAVDRILSGRTVSFATAGEMFLSSPVTGVGPGMFSAAYMDYKSLVEARFPVLGSLLNAEMNFGEVHNDHLEILAETGIPGYLLFLAAMYRLLRCARPNKSIGDDESLFASRFAIPFVASFCTLALAQFPLQLAAPRYILLMIAGLVTGWSKSNESA